MPTLINPDLPNLQAVLAKADVVIEVLDARNPLAYRSAHLEEAIAAKAGRKTLLVLSKIGAYGDYLQRREGYSFYSPSRCMSSRGCFFLGSTVARRSPNHSVPVGRRFPPS